MARSYMPEQMYPPYMYPMMMPRGGMPPAYGIPPMAPIQYVSPAQAPGPVPASVPAPEPSESALPTDKELLGERLYPLVEKIDQPNASKITGMLLEMEIEAIHNILRDPAQLNRWIQEAHKALDTSQPGA